MRSTFLAISSQNTIENKQRYCPHLLGEEKNKKRIRGKWTIFELPYRCFPYRFIFMQIKLNLIWKVLRRTHHKTEENSNSDMDYFNAHQVWFFNSRTRHQNDIVVKYFNLEVVRLVGISCCLTTIGITSLYYKLTWIKYASRNFKP